MHVGFALIGLTVFAMLPQVASAATCPDRTPAAITTVATESLKCQQTIAKAADLAAPLAVQALRIDAEIDRCGDTSGMLGCLFAPMPDPQCLGSAGRSIASDLVGAIFGSD